VAHSKPSFVRYVSPLSKVVRHLIRHQSTLDAGVAHVGPKGSLKRTKENILVCETEMACEDRWCHCSRFRYVRSWKGDK
jgi:hypothetical protein